MADDVIKARAFDALMAYFARNRVMVSLAEATRAVGGALHLETLLAENEVTEVDNNATKSNCKRLFPADQIYSHVRVYNK